jgi:RNA polymerase sigma factor (TIGR02999 family)
MADVTQILAAVARGDPLAAAELLPLVYDELRRLAAARLADERPGQTLQPTALVHEAYLRLVGPEDRPRWEGRGHFFAAAAEAIRRILVEAARRKHALKRGGGGERVELDPELFAAPEQPEDLIALDEALEQLARSEPRVAELVKLRYFAGLTIPQAAGVLGVAPRTADGWWAFARAWLLAKLRGDPL